jgi:GNAT superfamily N-acetyltransferase
MPFEILHKHSETEQDRKDLYGWGDGIDIWDVWELGVKWLPQTHHFIGYEDGKAVAHAGTLRHVVHHNGSDLCLGGLKSVLTSPDARGKGYGSKVIQAATDHMAQELSVNFGLLFCKESLLEFYTDLGWEHVTNDVIIIHPEDGKKPWPREVMIHKVGPAEWPTETIDLDSFPW